MGAGRAAGSCGGGTDSGCHGCVSGPGVRVRVTPEPKAAIGIVMAHWPHNLQVSGRLQPETLLRESDSVLVAIIGHWRPAQSQA